MNMQTERYPTLISDIAGQPIVALARKFGTPVFVYDAAKVVQRMNDLAAFDTVRFAQKACSNLAILDLVRRHGALVDAVSAGEIRRALAAGFRPGSGEPPEIFYTADIFDQESLNLVVEHDIPVNCGSPDMIDQLGERVSSLQRAGRDLTLRINPGFGHGHSQKTNTGGQQSKHGIWHEQLDDCLARAARYQLTVTGLHMHIGSGTDLEHLSQVCTAMATTASAVGPSVTSISAGGGLPTPYRDEDQPVDIAGYFALWDATRRELAEKFGHPVSLEIEPGRYLVAESGSLIAEIRAVKRMGENLFYLVDAGFNNLARPILYGAYHPMAICFAERDQRSEVGGQNDGSEPGRPRPRRHESEPGRPRPRRHDVVVGGPLCESGDIFTQESGGFVSSRELPEAAVGDYLVIGCAGAYGAVMGSNYNTKPLAAEVLIENGQARLIRARQTFEDVVRGEVIPK
jgi:diaminopimelate decarboxylase